MFGWHLDRELVSSDMVKTVNIAGAGIGGLTAAIALARRGISVAVYEQTAALSEVGAGLQLSPNAMQILRNLGLEDPLREFAFEPESAVIKDGTTSRTYVSVPVKDASETKFGAPYFSCAPRGFTSGFMRGSGAFGSLLSVGHAARKFFQFRVHRCTSS